MPRSETSPLDDCLDCHRFRKIVGGALSPLFANLYVRRFVLGWKALGHARRFDAHIVNYSDDFVICCRGTAAPARTAMRATMAKLKLAVNETKTRWCRLPEETFDSLRHTWWPESLHSFHPGKPQESRSEHSILKLLKLQAFR